MQPNQVGRTPNADVMFETVCGIVFTSEVKEDQEIPFAFVSSLGPKATYPRYSAGGLLVAAAFVAVEDAGRSLHPATIKGNRSVQAN